MRMLDTEAPPVPREPVVVFVADQNQGPAPWLMGAAVLALSAFRLVTGRDVVSGWAPEAVTALLVVAGAGIWLWWRQRARPHAVFDPATRTATFFEGDGESRLGFDEIEAVDIPKVLIDPGASEHQGSHSWSDGEPYYDHGPRLYVNLRGGGARLVRESSDHAELARTRALLEALLGHE